MSLDKAIQFMSDYRKDRAKALNNEVRQSWSTAPLKDIDEFSSDIFNSDEVNEAWQGLYNSSKSSPIDVRLLQGKQLEVAFLAGCRRDASIMFMAWSAPRRTRMPLDHDRFERSRLFFYQFKTNELKRLIKSFSVGS